MLPGSAKREAQRLLLPDGTVLAFDHLPGEAPGVLFCPGFNSDMQGDKAVALHSWCQAQDRQYTRFDYFGHGQSSGALEEGCIGRWRDDALAILDEITLGPQVIVGSSMGGWIMLLLALERPERVAGLLGIAAAPDFTERIRTERLNEAQLQELGNTGYCSMPSTYDDGQPYRISQQLLDASREHLLLHKSIPLTVPIRLIHGQDDTDVPWQHSLLLAEKLSATDVEVQLVKSGDHRLSRPEDLLRMKNVLIELLQRGGGGDEGGEMHGRK